MTNTVTSDTDERCLIGRLQQGDEEAFSVLYRRHAAHVLWAARGVVVDRCAAEDVTQEVFAFLWQNPSRVDLQRGQLRTLLMAMARYRAIDVVRGESSKRRRQQLVSRLPEPTPSLAAVDVAESVTDADTNARQVDALHVAVAQLPQQQRMSVQLAYFAGHTFREVATITGVPEGTAKSRLRSALHRLEHQLPAALFGIDEQVVTAGQRAS
jgi:RNA polymerase sigma-70 factor (ECF subfamily)